ncbi:NUDIX hydrolase [Streptomyces sp. NPDC051554]|uniref:NUDIX hydrolase n=1 Tax=Streptomyces sp. NPDC051554 TaxID=3365656 RepID=UPI0037971EFE
MAIPEYVTRLRSFVGREHLLWLPGVNAVVVDEHRRILLHRRAEDGCWSLISGILDPGEEPADGIAREVWEETGLIVNVDYLSSVTVSPLRVHFNGDHAQYLELTFRCSVSSGHAHVHDSESLEVGWFSLADMPKVEEILLPRISHALTGVRDCLFQRPDFCPETV